MAPAPSTMISMAAQLIMPRGRRQERSRLVRGKLSADCAFKATHFVESFARFRIPSHPLENVREEEMLARLLRLPGQSTPLGFQGVFESALPDLEKRKKV